MMALFLAQAAVVSVLLGLWGYASPRTFGLPTASRVLIALSLTPLVLGAIPVTVAAVAPGAPRVVFLLGPVVPVAALCWLMRGTVRAAHREAIQSLRRLLRDPGRIFAILIVVLIAAMLLGRILAGADGTPIGHDALTYFAEARAFAQARDIALIPRFDSPLGQVVKTHPHHFLFQGYIANGLMAAGDAIGHPDDYVARLAVQGVLLFVMLGVLGLTLAVGPVWTVALAATLIFLMGGFEYVARQYSRDAFRVLPFVAIIAVALTGVGRREPLPLGRVALFGALVGANVLVHTVNVMLLSFGGAALTLLAVIRRYTWRNVLVLALGSGPFAAITCWPYVSDYVHRGNLLGHGLHYFFYRDTVLWPAFADFKYWMKPIGFLEALERYGSQYGMAFSIAAVLAALVVLPGLRRRQPGRGSALGFTYLVLYFGPLAFTVGELSLRGSMVSNLRYGIPILALAPAVIAHGVAVALFTLRIRYRFFWLRPRLITAFLAIALAAVSTWSIGTWHLYNNQRTTRYLDRQELFVSRLADSLPPGARWVTDRYTVAYFAHRVPIFFYTDEGQPFLKARNTTEVWSLIEKYNIRMVALYRKSPGWWPKTSLYQALTHSTGVRWINSESWKIFLIDELPGATTPRRIKE